VTVPDYRTEDVSAESEVRPNDDSVGRRRTMPSLIGYTVVMKGELTVGEDLVIEGTFDGTITGDGHDTVTVRRIARLSGHVTASDLLVEDGTDLQNTVLSGRIRLADDKRR
jgi:cytoskeletal protein CcmA (bactofilin family)